MGEQNYETQNISQLATALAKAQGEMKNPPLDSTNPHFKSKYSSLASVRDTVTPILTKHGLAVVQLLGNDSAGNLSCTTTLIHESGESIQTTLSIPGKHDAHGMGSCATYARRYTLMAICGVVGDEDDDGNAVMQPPDKQSTKLSDDKVKEIKDQLAEVEADIDKFFKYIGVQTFGELTEDHLPKIETAIASKRGQQ